MNVTVQQSDIPVEPWPERRIALNVIAGGIGYGSAGGVTRPGWTVRVSASGRHSADEGWALWSLDRDDTARLLNNNVHQLPYGTFEWMIPPIAHADGKARLFATRDYRKLVRASEFVDVVIPTMPPPREVTARDGSRKVIFTGRSVPRTQVRASLGGRNAEGTAADDRFEFALDNVARGTHAFSMVAVGLHDAPDSAPVQGTVKVAAPPAIPLNILFPEAGRRIRRVERVTGVAAPGSDIEVMIGEGAAVKTQANAGGAWEAARVESVDPGKAVLRARNVTTGELVDREVEVEHFSKFMVTQLAAGPLVDQNGLVTRRGAIAEGTGVPGTVIEVASRAPGNPFVELAAVSEDGVWVYQHVDESTAPLFGPGRVRLRVAGEDFEVTEVAVPQAPLVLTPRMGEVTAAVVRVSGVAVKEVSISMEDGITHKAKPDTKNAYRWEVTIGPLAPGTHTIDVATSSQEREKVTVHFAVNPPD